MGRHIRFDDNGKEHIVNGGVHATNGKGCVLMHTYKIVEGKAVEIQSTVPRETEGNLECTTKGTHSVISPDARTFTAGTVSVTPEKKVPFSTLRVPIIKNPYGRKAKKPRVQTEAATLVSQEEVASPKELFLSAEHKMKEEWKTTVVDEFGTTVEFLEELSSMKIPGVDECQEELDQKPPPKERSQSRISYAAGLQSVAHRAMDDKGVAAASISPEGSKLAGKGVKTIQSGSVSTTYFHGQDGISRVMECDMEGNLSVSNKYHVKHSNWDHTTNILKGFCWIPAHQFNALWEGAHKRGAIYPSYPSANFWTVAADRAGKSHTACHSVPKIIYGRRGQNIVLVSVALVKYLVPQPETFDGEWLPLLEMHC